MLQVSFIEFFLKSIEILIVSAVKFIFAAPLSYLVGFNYFQTFVITAIGGVAGVLFFYYLSGWIFKRFKSVKYSIKPEKVETSKLYKYNHRLFDKIRMKYGLLGLIVLTPVFFSIPLGSIMAKKYYSAKKRIPLYLTLSVIGWSYIIATLLKFMNY